MTLTRATIATSTPGADGIAGTADDVRGYINTTAPLVDLSQNYSSHPSHQVFLREYTLNALGQPVSTGKLAEGAGGAIINWGEVKAMARTMLGIELSDADVFNVPVIATDAYGKFIPGANGLPQLVTTTGLFEGNRAVPVSLPANVLRTGRKGLAAATLILDGLKGAVAVLLARYFLGDQDVVVGTAAVLGHLFPVWLGFRGGKGAATGLGVLLAAAWPVGLACCAVWLVAAKLLKMSSAAALAAFAAAPLFALVLSSADHALMALLIAILVFWRHEANIRRLLAGTEPRIGKTVK
jgi:glycerol-3-phosphate acyltransferase PlsY